MRTASVRLLLRAVTAGRRSAAVGASSSATAATKREVEVDMGLRSVAAQSAHVAKLR